MRVLGAQKGRNRNLTKLVASGVPIERIAAEWGIQRATVLRYLRFANYDYFPAPREVKEVPPEPPAQPPPDERQLLCPATWDVYAASLTPEEMHRWFRRGS